MFLRRSGAIRKNNFISPSSDDDITSAKHFKVEICKCLRNWRDVSTTQTTLSYEMLLCETAYQDDRSTITIIV